MRLISKLVSDEMWALFEPLLPEPKPRRFRLPGRKPVDNRVALTVIMIAKSASAMNASPPFIPLWCKPLHR